MAPARSVVISQDASDVIVVRTCAFGPLASAALAAENDSEVGSEYQPGWTVGAPVSARSRRNANSDETMPFPAIVAMTCPIGSPSVIWKTAGAPGEPIG